jgi:hypothetical protein
MARTTGYTATVAARMLHAGLYDTRGVSAPEFIGRTLVVSSSCWTVWRVGASTMSRTVTAYPLRFDDPSRVQPPIDSRANGSTLIT